MSCPRDYFSPHKEPTNNTTNSPIPARCRGCILYRPRAADVSPEVEVDEEAADALAEPEEDAIDEALPVGLLIDKVLPIGKLLSGVTESGRVGAGVDGVVATPSVDEKEKLFPSNVRPVAADVAAASPIPKGADWAQKDWRAVELPCATAQMKVVSVHYTAEVPGKLLTKDHIVSSGGYIRWNCDVDALAIAVEAYCERNFDCMVGRTQSNENWSAMWSNPVSEGREPSQREFIYRVW